MPKVDGLMGDPVVKKLFDSVKANGVVSGAGRRLLADRRVATTSKAVSANPKDIVGSTKAAMLLFPPIAQIHAVDAMMDGAGKYDPYNWRAKDITVSNYLYAAIRHILDYWEGEECAPDSRAKHLGHAIATLGIVLDAQAHKCLIDDRPASDGGVAINEAFAIVVANEALRKAERQRKLNEACVKVGIMCLEAGRKKHKKGKKK